MEDELTDQSRYRRNQAISELAVMAASGEPEPLEFFDGTRPSTATGTEQIEVIENAEGRFYEVLVDGTYAGILVYELAGNRRILTHTFIQEEFRGRGLVTQLLTAALLDMDRAGRTITSYCPVVNAFLARHPEYDHLIDPDHPGTARAI